MAAARELATNVVRAIEQLHAHGPNVVTVIIPDHWEPWTKVETEEAKFDFCLHDFVKAFCVQRGIATQFLRESTLLIYRRAVSCGGCRWRCTPRA